MAKKKFNNTPFAYHQEIELEISTLTNLGVGLGRVSLAATDGDPPTGWVVMVLFALPGEQVRVRIFRNNKNYSEADLIEILRPSPHRIPAPCPLFGRCGGCQYQNLPYKEQLIWKRRHVEEVLRHLANLELPVAPVIGSPREFGYRSKITPHFAAPREPNFPIGFLRAGTRFDLIDVPLCPISTDAINEKLPTVRAQIRERADGGAFPRGATILLRDASGEVTTDYDQVITETIGLLKLRFLARDFFQNNPSILPAFTQYVKAQAAGSGARFLVDAYCGSGLFALTAAPAFARVAGIEVSASSIAFARENAARNGIDNATFKTGDASEIFAGLDFPPSETAVVIDPPRKGCDQNFLQQLFAFGARTVVYVSCDPATQMRDLTSFTAAGYIVTAVQPFDLFPQTRHLECVVSLTKTL